MQLWPQLPCLRFSESPHIKGSWAGHEHLSIGKEVFFIPQKHSTDTKTKRIVKSAMFSDEQLQRLTMLVLCIAGEKDVMRNSAQTGERIHTLLPNAYMRVITGAGHALVSVTKDISLFLNKN